MGTSLAMCWLLTQRNLTHISKTTGEPSSPGEKSGIDQHWSLVRFQCSTTKSPVLKSVTLLDTPGIISLTLTECDTWIGTKKTKNRHPRWREADPEQRLWLHRGPQVVCGKSRQVKKSTFPWSQLQHGSSFRIILVFDAHKLDISDEFKHAIEAIRSQDDKIRIILNKADMMTHQQLMRVYGALMWSLSKILGNPEVKELVHGGDGSNLHPGHSSVRWKFLESTSSICCQSRAVWGRTGFLIYLPQEFKLLSSGRSLRWPSRAAQIFHNEENERLDKEGPFCKGHNSGSERKQNTYIKQKLIFPLIFKIDEIGLKMFA